MYFPNNLRNPRIMPSIFQTRQGGPGFCHLFSRQSEESQDYDIYFPEQSRRPRVLTSLRAHGHVLTHADLTVLGSQRTGLSIGCLCLSCLGGGVIAPVSWSFFSRVGIFVCPSLPSAKHPSCMLQHLWQSGILPVVMASMLL